MPHITAIFGKTFDNLEFVAPAMDRRCSAILRSIQKYFLSESTIGAGICSMVIAAELDKITLARLDTPIGRGRFVRKWSLRDATLQAKLVFERASLDEYDVQFWEPVWEIEVPAEGSAVSGSGDDAISYTFSGFDEHEKMVAFAAANAILRGLVS